MDIVIAGAGTVGYSLAASLSYRHNVIVIDKDGEKLARLEDANDVYVICGDIEDPNTYRALMYDKIDLFIAVTDSDEANLLATLVIEDVVTLKRKIVRLKNDGFLQSGIMTKLGIDEAVFPDLITAEKVKSLLRFPKANNVKSFRQTDMKLISIKVENRSDRLKTVADLQNDTISVVGIERQKRFFIPNSTEEIENGDLIYLFGNADDIARTADILNETMPNRVKRVVIFGADITAQKIANALLDQKLEIKMIEKDRTLCKRASEFLQGRVAIINSAYEDERLFTEEGLQYADMVVAAGKNDETNIVKCVEAKEYGIGKVVAINNDRSYYHLMHQMGVVVVRGSKAGAHYAILEKIASSSIVAQRLYCGGKAVMFMRKIYPGSPLISKRIKSIKVSQTAVKIVRDDILFDIDRIDAIREGDIIVVFGSIESKDEMQRWIYAL